MTPEKRKVLKTLLTKGNFFVFFARFDIIFSNCGPSPPPQLAPSFIRATVTMPAKREKTPPFLSPCLRLLFSCCGLCEGECSFPPSAHSPLSPPPIKFPPAPPAMGEKGGGESLQKRRRRQQLLLPSLHFALPRGRPAWVRVGRPRPRGLALHDLMVFPLPL